MRIGLSMPDLFPECMKWVADECTAHQKCSISGCRKAMKFTADEILDPRGRPKNEEERLRRTIQKLEANIARLRKELSRYLPTADDIIGRARAAK